MGKINIPTVFNWIPVFNKMAAGCDVPIPISAVDDFRFELMACSEDARRAKVRTVFYRYGVIGTAETHYGDIKAVSFKDKNQANLTKSGDKASGVTKADVVKCQFCGKTITLMPIAVLEPLSSPTIRTGLISVLRPMVG